MEPIESRRYSEECGLMLRLFSIWKEPEPHESIKTPRVEGVFASED